MDRIGFWQHCEQICSSVTIRGNAEQWLAPVTLIEAREGFNEDSWVDGLPDTTLVLFQSGDPVRKCRGPMTGMSPAKPWVTVIPTGGPTTCITDGTMRGGHIYLPLDLLRRGGEQAGYPELESKVREDLVFVTSGELLARAQAYLGRAVDTRQPPSRLEMEGRVLLLIDSLVAVHAKPAPAPRGGLAPQQLRRAIEFLTANLTRDPGLESCAQAVGLSAKHFARAFRESTGLPPHQWVIARRLELAYRLLGQSSENIASIASSSGFADQSHFTAAFRKAYGVTPARFRAQMR